MIKEFYTKKLLIGIMIVTLLLMVCITVDYADDNITIENINDSVKQTNTSKVEILNGTQYVKGNDNESYFIAKTSDKIHTVKDKNKENVKKLPTISMYAKPSCGCRHSYTWHYRTFVNYCPNCGHYMTLRRNPKGVPEKEFTCSRCSSDFCGVCGKEKYSWSHVYLRMA